MMNHRWRHYYYYFSVKGINQDETKNQGVMWLMENIMPCTVKSKPINSTHVLLKSSKMGPTELIGFDFTVCEV